MDVVAEGLGFTEGPVCLPDGRIALVSISHQCVYVVSPGGPVERFETGGGPNGLALGPDDALYVAQNGGVWGAPSKAPAGVQVLRDGRIEYVAEGMGAPNDCVIGPDGRLWVTDTVTEFAWGDRPGARPGQVWAVDLADGACDLVLESGPLFLNGLGFTPDGRQLLVTETLDAKLSSYDVSEVGLTNQRVLHTFAEGHPDGLAITSDGVALVALTSADRIDAIAPDGALVGRLDLPAGSLPTNVCLAHDLGYLYVTAAHAGALLRVESPV